MRAYIDMVESVSVPLYHGSKRELQDGTILTSNRVNHDDEASEVVERLLEQFRPSHNISRSRCIFMITNRDIDSIERVGGYADYVYEVNPLTVVFKYDVTWWGMIFDHVYDYIDATDEERERIVGEVRPFIESYWRGSASTNPVWEYLAERVQVVGLVGGYNA